MVNMHAQLCSEAICFNFYSCPNLHLYFMCTSSEDSADAQTRLKLRFSHIQVHVHVCEK